MAIIQKKEGTGRSIWRLIFWFLYLKRDGDYERAGKVKKRLADKDYYVD